VVSSQRPGQTLQEEAQPALPFEFESVQSPGAGPNKLNGGFADPAFADNKQQPVHRWVPWIAGFSAEFVRDAFARYLSGGHDGAHVVLDPFCGVGTTLIEALLSGFDAVGFEINPYAALAARAKCEAGQITPEQLSDSISRFCQFMKEANGDIAAPPAHFRSRIPFFGERAEARVLRALRFVQRLEPGPVRDLFTLALGAVMVSLSNYSYEPSLSSRPAAGKPMQEDAPVVETMIAKLLAMKSDIQWLHERMLQFGRRPNGRVIEDSFLNAAKHLAPDSMDLIVTSPPYLNNYHYVRNTRPQLFWLGFVRTPGELKRLEQENFGKYWQTVRGLKRIALEFHHDGLTEKLEQLRRVNVERGPYGGQGWANYAASYFNDLNRFCAVVSRVLKPNACAVVVVGNSILQGVEFPVDNLLSELAAPYGLHTENIHVVRQKRVGDSIVTSSVRQGPKSTARLYESAVVLRKSSTAHVRAL
jgi:DNA modification methylase